MKEDVIFLKCDNCGELNRIDINIPAQECVKCGKKIVTPQGEKKIKSSDKIC